MEKQNINFDFVSFVKIAWSKRKLFIKVWIATVVVSSIWIFPQPRFYSCEVSLAPETNDMSNASGGLASLASNFGINLGNMASQDAIYPELYPDLFKSPDFIVSLFDIKITTKDKKISTDYYSYLKEYQRENPFAYPFIKLADMFADKESRPKKFNSFMLTKEQNKIKKKVEENITCMIDKKTSVVTIKVLDQDALVCAVLADSIKCRLQSFITEYRTKKARVDYEYYSKLCAESKATYEKARQLYGSYSDSNQDVFLASYKSKQEDLENDMQMKYNLYTAMNTRLEAAMAKVQESTPVFTTLKSASVPLKPAGPKRIIFIVVWLFLTTFGTIAYLFFREIKDK